MTLNALEGRSWEVDVEMYVGAFTRAHQARNLHEKVAEEYEQDYNAERNPRNNTLGVDYSGWASYWAEVYVEALTTVLASEEKAVAMMTAVRLGI